MKLPTHEEWMNDRLIGAVMKAKSCSRPDAVAHLEERFCAMEAAAQAGASDEEIAQVGMPMRPEEFFGLVFSDADSLMNKTDIKIVSGGQTGVDQGALAAAIDLGLDWGGWAPKGWRAENGTIGERYRANMRELGSANYLVRTRRNVADSHATLILTDRYPLSGGTLKTRQFCQELMRSHFAVCLDEADAVQKTRNWLLQFFTGPRQTPFALNVAGPRESKSPGIEKRTRQFLAEVLQAALAR